MDENVNRRRFLGAAIGTGAAAALAPEALAAGRRGRKGRRSDRDNRVPKNRRGIQLYTMREKMKTQAQARRVLRFLGRIGYTEVETAGHYGWTAKQFRRELRQAGLRAPSGHDGPDFNFPSNWESEYEKTLEYAAELGQKFTGFAWFPGPYDDEALWHRFARNFNRAGQLARKHGMQFFYHNHDFEFTNRFNGKPAYDILLEETDRDLVKFELDLFWITEGGESAIEYLKADPRRYPLYHVKDHVWGDRRKADGSDEADFEDAGVGMIDFPQAFDAGDGRGNLDKHYFAEHDAPWLSHPDDPRAEFKTARNAIAYLKRVRW